MTFRFTQEVEIRGVSSYGTGLLQRLQAITLLDLSRVLGSPYIFIITRVQQTLGVARGTEQVSGHIQIPTSLAGLVHQGLSGGLVSEMEVLQEPRTFDTYNFFIGNTNGTPCSECYIRFRYWPSHTV